MLRSVQSRIRPFITLVVAFMIGACEDPVTTAPKDDDSAPQPNVIACRADVTAGEMTCRGGGGEPVAGLSLSVVLGGQGTMVNLASGNVTYSSASQIFQADVTVQNLTGQALGTADGTTVTGIRVFFHSGPTVTSSNGGTVSLANEDGVDTFTGANQPYFAYSEILQPNEVSEARAWQWTVTPEVETFEFSVLVSADVRYPDGWVRISPLIDWVAPGQTLQLNAVARDFVGRVVERDFAWRSLDESRATVSATGLVSGVNYGPVYITAESDGPEASGLAGIIVDGFSGSWVAVSAGRRHTCGLDSNGKAYCWGYNFNGQLGNGSTLTFLGPMPVWPGYGVRRLQSISTASAHSCAIDLTGRGYCWGQNSRGELGSGSTSSDSIPVAVVGGLTFTRVTTGTDYTCALSTASAVWCWGDNDDGQLGTGQGSGYAVGPQQVSGEFGRVSGGDFHACAVTTGGEPYCWGYNQDGQLGIGQLSFWERIPNKVITSQVTAPALFTSVSAGFAHTCGVTSAHEAYCWGLNGPRIGRPYDPFIEHYLIPHAVQGGLSFATISAGTEHTCGVTTGGQAYCWGENFWGKLGDGSTVARYAPTLVSGGHTFVAVSAGDEHTCGVTTDGDLYCWGYGGFGRLGNVDDRPIAFTTPQLVADPLSDSQVWQPMLSSVGTESVSRLVPE